MKLAIIGSREIKIYNLDKYVPEGVCEIVSGGAKGIDTLAAEYARKTGVKLTEFLPEYKRYGRAAPIVRNKQIAEYSDEALVLWNGISKGTMHTVGFFEKLGKKVTLITLKF